MTNASEDEKQADILSVTHLKFGYAGDSQPVIQSLSFSIRKGERVAILGANGSGKSTLFRLLLGLLPAADGNIAWFGEPNLRQLSSGRLRLLRRRIGFIPQHHGLSTRLSVLSNVLHGRLSLGQVWRRSFQSLAQTSEREDAIKCVGRVGLAHRTLHPCQELSGGESQRVALARALFANPEVIIADEPAASLDPGVAQEMMLLLQQEAIGSGRTLLFATHSLAHVLQFSDRVLAIKRGEIILDRPTQLCSDSELRSLYD